MNYLNLTCPPLPCFEAGGKCTYEPGDHIERRLFRKKFTLIYVENGSLALEQDGINVTLGAGGYFVVTPDTPIQGYNLSQGRTTLYWVNFTSSPSYSLSDDYVPDTNADVSSKGLTSFQLFVISLRRYNTIEEHTKKSFEKRIRLLVLVSSGISSGESKPKKLYLGPPASPFDLQIDFIQILSILHTQSLPVQPKSNIAEIIHDYFDQHYTEDIHLGELAKQHSYSSSHVIRCFNEVYGISPMQYVKQLRIEKAKQLLTKTNMPIQNVAIEAGFNVTSYFIRQFKNETGTTPSQYRIKMNAANQP